MLREGVVSRRFSEPEEIFSAQDGVFLQAIPTGEGPFRVDLTTIQLGGMSLHVGHSSPFMGFAKAAPDRAVLQLPLENVETLALNGVTCRRGTVGVYACNAELLRANPQPTSHAALILPFDAVERLLEPPLGSKLLQPGAHTLFQANPSAWERSERIIRAAQETAVTVPDIFATEQPRLALREGLLRAAHNLVVPERETEIRAPRSTCARRRIVAAADEYLRAHMDRPIYTEELCDVLAVSASSLAEAFRAVFVISPHRFLKLRRLSMVRAALRSEERPSPLVKSVALSHGFWHLGQFAHDYRETFGETPSETLARARGDAVEASA
jgi:AraC family transcriptional regulator, ethanolamine operon transcriptional activator